MSQSEQIPQSLYAALLLLMMALVVLVHAAVPAILHWSIGAMSLLAVNVILPILAIRQTNFQMLELGLALLFSWVALSGLLVFPPFVSLAFICHGIWALMHFLMPWGARAPAWFLLIITTFDFLYAVWLVRGFEF